MKTVHSCSLCGWILLSPIDMEPPLGPELAWMGQFIGVYFDERQSKVLVTGVGIQDDDEDPGYVLAPKNPDHRWDHAGHGYENRDENLAEKHGQVVLAEGDDSVFHVSCWSLLKHALSPHPIPVQRLHDVCRSLPTPFRCTIRSWGHDYGGRLMVHGPHEHYPWEEKWEDVNFEPDSFHCADPCDVPQAQAILEKIKMETFQLPQFLRGPLAFDKGVTSTASAQGSHRSLPPEICLHVATLLPTADALNARLACRSFAGLFYNQAFWASRFEGEGDRSWFIEARNRRIYNWRALYDQTRSSHLENGLKNRERIWPTIALAIGVLELQQGHDSLQHSTCSEAENRSRLSTLAVTGCIWEPEKQFIPSFEHGCRILYYASAVVPNCSSAQFTAHFVTLGDAKYVCGLQLDTNRGDHLQLGYLSQDTQKQTVRELHGVVIAVCARGIQALQLVSAEGIRSPWLGSPDGCLRTHRLKDLGTYEELHAGFDGCKLIALDVSESTSKSSSNKTLQDSALWYPDIPEESWCLNEYAFWSMERYITGFKPLFWCHFGGSGGVRLSALTRIRGTGNLHRLEFFYDGANAPDEACTIGRHEPLPDSSHVDFFIDGPGGERIESVELWCHPFDEDRSVYKYGSAKEGELFTCKVYTNWGRSNVLSGRYDPPNGVVYRIIHAKPGNAITGFYAEQMPELTCGLTAFGVITEPLESTSH